MNFPCHEFSKKNKNELLEFLKIANENKSNPFCNSNMYDNLSTVYLLKPDTKKLLQEYISKSSDIIDITLNDNSNEEQAINSPTNTIESMNQTIEDVTHAIKENLQNQKCLSENIIEQLNNLQNVENIFRVLSTALSLEEITDFGKTLISTNCSNPIIITFYLKYLFLRQASNKITEQLRFVFNAMAQKYPNDLVVEISKFVTSQNDESSKPFLEYLDGLQINLKTKLLQVFLLDCEQFQDKYISVVENLISNQTDLAVFSKLIELLSASSEQFTSNKGFGKLLMSIVKYLGRNVQGSIAIMLSHIIASHRSIWKSKIQKCFDDLQQDSSVFSQSQLL